LQGVVIALARRGCHVVLSNSTAAEIVDLYDASAESRAAGLRALRVPARRAVNRNPSGRGPVDEVLITNIGAAPRGGCDRRAGGAAGGAKWGVGAGTDGAGGRLPGPPPGRRRPPAAPAPLPPPPRRDRHRGHEQLRRRLHHVPPPAHAPQSGTHGGPALPQDR